MKNVANATHYLNMDTKELFNLYNKNKTICKILNHFRKKFKPLQIQGFKKNI